MSESSKQFQWTGIDKKGKRISGSLEAAEISVVQQELKTKGVEVVSIKETHQINIGTPRAKKIKQKDIVLFTRLLSTMMTAGLPILQAIELIARDQENPAVKNVLLQIRSNVAGGKTLTEAFRKYPKQFNSLYCSLISAAEKSGTLDKILNRLAIYLEKAEAIKRKVKKALVYPVIIIVVSIVVSGILLIFVVPQFQTIFSSFGAELPYFTRVVVKFSDILRGYWWIVLSGVVGLFLWFRYLLKHNENFAMRYDQFLLKIPVIGILLRKSILARFTRTLAITLDAGLPIVETMNTMADVVDNRVYSKAILQISNSLLNGHQLNFAMSSTKLFPNMTIQMIAIGESSGALSDMLNKIADYYEEDVNHIVDNLSSLLEPLIMILLGVIIGGFVIAMYLPIFKIGSIVK